MTIDDRVEGGVLGTPICHYAADSKNTSISYPSGVTSIARHVKMKSIAKICASALLLILPVAADNALVYLSPSLPKTDLPASLTPSEARLVIAERLGLSRYHSLREADERSLRAINAFGAQSQSLFTSQHADPPRHALAIIEGIVEPEGTIV